MSLLLDVVQSQNTTIHTSAQVYKKSKSLDARLST